MLSAATQSKDSPTTTLSCAAVGESQCAPQHEVRPPLRRLTAAELELHIASCGYLMLEAYKRYEASGCFGDRGEADRWKVLMEEAIKSRSAAQVARMEAARGLNGR